MHPVAQLENIRISAYTVPTATPEADGTADWSKTTIVIIQPSAGGITGLGYSYADLPAAHLIEGLLVPKLKGLNAFDVGGAWQLMTRAIRNVGRPGIASMAIAAVDNALWDLKARLVNLSVSGLLGAVRPEVLAYGSGGFTSYTDPQLSEQLGGWAQRGFKAVKMKIGRSAEEDRRRAKFVRSIIGDSVDLFVDANGAYTRKEALAQAQFFSSLGVTWFEEPVSSDDLAGLHFLRDQGPAGMNIAAGEYGYDSWYFRRMLAAEAVDVLQADATRCAGITGFLQADALCQSHSMPLSAHTSPSIHAHACCGAQNALNLEYFFDHARIENMAFDGVLQVEGGMLRPDLHKPGFGLSLKEAEMKQFKVFDSVQKLP